MKSKFSVRLKQRRKELNMTVVDLADACGLTNGCISQYENGIREPGYERLIALSSVLKVTIDYLIGKSDYSMDDLLCDGRMVDMLYGIPNLSEENKHMLFTLFNAVEGVEKRKRRNSDELRLRNENRNSR